MLNFPWTATPAPLRWAEGFGNRRQNNFRIFFTMSQNASGCPKHFFLMTIHTKAYSRKEFRSILCFNFEINSLKIARELQISKKMFVNWPIGMTFVWQKLCWKWWNHSITGVNRQKVGIWYSRISTKNISFLFWSQDDVIFPSKNNSNVPMSSRRHV